MNTTSRRLTLGRVGRGLLIGAALAGNVGCSDDDVPLFTGSDGGSDGGMHSSDTETTAVERSSGGNTNTSEGVTESAESTDGSSAPDPAPSSADTSGQPSAPVETSQDTETGITSGTSADPTESTEIAQTSAPPGETSVAVETTIDETSVAPSSSTELTSDELSGEMSTSQASTEVDSGVVQDGTSQGGPDLSWGEVTDAGHDAGDDAAMSDGETVSEDAGQTTLDAAVPTCEDGLKNGGETDVDCGGPCGANCEENQACTSDDDCVNGQCEPLAQSCGGNVRIFDFTGIEETFVLPTGVEVNVKMWGAGGQNSGYHFRHDPGGGGGGFAEATLEGTGQSVKILVGEGPPHWNGVAGPYFGGGGRSADCGPNGAGGGRSQLALDNDTILLIAGGGGGAGSGTGGYGGAGGGVNGGGTEPAVGGLGGTLESGFAPFIGQDAADDGGGGGGGWYGGFRGTGSGCNTGGGGGGGSSYVATELVLESRLVPGDGSDPGEIDDPDRGGAGEGGITDWAAGSHGRVVISWGQD